MAALRPVVPDWTSAFPVAAGTAPPPAGAPGTLPEWLAPGCSDSVVLGLAREVACACALPAMALHLAGRGRRRLTGRFACVVAPECVWADGLTNVVLAKGPRAAALLRAFGAHAYALGQGRAWRTYGLAA